MADFGIYKRADQLGSHGLYGLALGSAASLFNRRNNGAQMALQRSRQQGIFVREVLVQRAHLHTRPVSNFGGCELIDAELN